MKRVNFSKALSGLSLVLAFLSVLPSLFVGAFGSAEKSSVLKNIEVQRQFAKKADVTESVVQPGSSVES